MSIKFAHTNIVSKNWKKLSNFYINVFGCKQIMKTSLSGSYVDKGTGVNNADIKGVSLQLPGYNGQTPSLEIFSYVDSLEREVSSVANREGFGHIAFQVDDVTSVLGDILENGGGKVGEIVFKEYKSGTLTFVYAADPEGNIIELLNWLSK